MYAKMKEHFMKEFSKKIDKEINDQKSFDMELVIFVEGIQRNKAIDNIFYNYFNKHPYSINFKYKIPTKRLIQYTTPNGLARNVPRRLVKDGLVKNYYHQYFKFYYEDILEDYKKINGN